MEMARKPAPRAGRTEVAGLEHPGRRRGSRLEKWMNFPRERERLYKLFRETGAQGLIILSGDRHLAELSTMDAGLGYPMYDLTSSGLNQAFRSWQPLETNRHRVATMGWGDNFGLIRRRLGTARPGNRSADPRRRRGHYNPTKAAAEHDSA